MTRQDVRFPGSGSSEIPQLHDHLYENCVTTLQPFTIRKLLCPKSYLLALDKTLSHPFNA